MSDLRKRLLSMPSSLNDACRTMEEAADEIKRLRAIAIDRMDLFRQAANNVERMADEIARLRAQLARTQTLVGQSELEEHHQRQRAERAEAQLASARKALEPFAALAKSWPNHPLDFVICSFGDQQIKVRDLRASALTDEKGTRATLPGYTQYTNYRP